MKKIVSFVLLISLSFLLFACGEPEEFWKDTEASYQIILGTDELPINEEIFYNHNLTYSSQINLAINDSSSDYYTLNIYENILHLSFLATQDYYKNFGIVTLKTQDENVKNKHKELVKDINDLEKEIKEFYSAKTTFVNNLKPITDILTSPIALQELKEYKRAFSKLILAVSECNNLFLDTYEISYEILQKENDLDGKYAYASSLTKMVYAFNLYAFGENDGQYLSNVNASALIVDLATKFENASTFTSTYFEEWKNVYNAFITELSIFEDCLEKIDVTNYDNTNKFEQAYYNKVNDFMNHYMYEMYNFTLKLIGE